jgi:hypothetical protein
MQSLNIPIGAPVDAESLQQIFSSLAAPGILTGFQLSASAADQIAISPGGALTDSGIFIFESEIQTLPFTQTVQPGNFTIYYQYQQSQVFGGTSAQIQMQSGLIPEDLFSNGVILGWLQYPGGSAALATSMFVSAKRYRLDQPAEKNQGVFLTRYAPFSTSLTLTGATGSFPVVTEAYSGSLFAPVTTIQNTGAIVSNAAYIYPFQIQPYGLGKILVEFSITASASCTINLMRSDGTVVSPIESNFFINQSMQVVELSFAQSNNFVPGNVAYIQFVLAMQPANSMTIKSIGNSAYTEPF